jgi:ribA/ribD-fused uncharacterized protein
MKKDTVTCPVLETNEINILIKKVKDSSGWLSCMSAHPVNYKDKQYRTCEALFQWRRFDGHPEVQEEIMEAKSPLAVKMIARKSRDLLNRGVKWDEAPKDIELMKMCLKLKLEQHPDLQEKLIDTGDATIIEDCTSHDRESARFWGMVYKGNNWVGENILGKLWMEIRDEINNNSVNK